MVSNERDMTVGEAAEALRVSRNTVIQRIKDGKLQAYNVGTEGHAVWRIPPSALERFRALASNVTTPQEKAPLTLPRGIRALVGKANHGRGS